MPKTLIKIFCWMFILVCLSSVANAQQPDAPAAAVSAAQHWLTMTDEGQFDQTWDEASSYFKSLVAKEQWVSQISAVRQPFGKLTSRNLQKTQFLTSLPGAPDGEYEVMIFQSVLEHKASAVETLTMMKDTDGQWRLAGYFIK